jgi:hypothetical protein
MVRPFFKGALVATCVVSALFLLLLGVAGPSWVDGSDVIVTLIASALVGTGVGGPIGAARGAVATTGPRWTMVFSRRAKPAPEPAGPRLDFVVAALLAAAPTTLLSLLALGALGRGDLRRLVQSAVPYEIGRGQAWLMVLGTIFICAFALTAGAMRLRARDGGLRPVEQRLLALSGFLAGFFGLPSLAAMF